MAGFEAARTRRRSSEGRCRTSHIPHPTSHIPRTAGFEEGQQALAYATHVLYAYHMATRTTILLDNESREALEQLTRRHGWSMSEAIRRAVVQLRDRSTGVPEARRRQRVAALKKLIELTEGNDAAEEIARRKAEDEFG